MTRITLTWQKDAEHKKPFDEEVELEDGSPSQVSLEELESMVVTKDATEYPYKLSRLEGVVVNVALNDCVEQLSVIKCVVNEHIPDSWHKLFEYQTLSERFKSSPRKKQKYIEEAYEKIPYIDKQKLQKDVCFVITILSTLCREIAEKGVFSSVKDVLDDLKRQEEDNRMVEGTSLHNEATLEATRKRLIREKKEFIEMLEKAKDQIGDLKNEMENILSYGKQEFRYTQDWESARSYQHGLLLTEQENGYHNIINNHLVKIDYENRVHNEVGNYIEENTEDLRNSIDYWMRNYDEEIERRDSEIIKLKMTWEALTEDHRVLRETYEERVVFIKYWLELKEERRKQAELERLQTWAAIKIQAWWRGTMVRKKLGPYRKKKKGKKGEKDKKGKKKKK